MKGKRVLVVGGGKSAVDNAVSAAKVGVSSTLLFREAHWPVPRYLLNLIPFKWGTYSRFGHFMLHTYHEVSPLTWWFHCFLAPLKWLFWRVVELMFCLQFGLSGDALPQTPIEIDLFTGGQILNYEYRDMLSKGQVASRKGAIDHFLKDGVVLVDGTKLEVDVVIYGTGFRKNYDILDEVTQQKLEVAKDGLYLFRNIIPPTVPNLALSAARSRLSITSSRTACKLFGCSACLPEALRCQSRASCSGAWKRSSLGNVLGCPRPALVLPFGSCT